MTSFKNMALVGMMFASLGLVACQHLPQSATPVVSHAKTNHYQHIRNATAKIEYAGKTFLVDPYLAEKGRYLPPNAKVANPLIDLSQSIDEVLSGVDAVIVTHTHPDHWDEVAQNSIPKDMPIFVQNAGDARLIRSQGFSDVKVMGKGTAFGDIKLTKTRGQHGTDEMYANPKIAEMVGDAMGVVFQADGQPTVYLVGDTIYNHEVAHAFKTYKPDFVVLNAGYAKLPNFEGSPIMGTKDVAQVHNHDAKTAQIVTVHMDALPQTTISTEAMREFVKQQGLQRVIVPNNGETIKF